MNISKLITLGISILAVSAMSLASGIRQDESKDIVDIAASAPQFSTLVAAVKAAGLVDTLKSAGPFTVFAPTNDAFKKLEAKKPGILEMLLKPENKAKLVKILTYHVVPGKVLAEDVLKLKNGTKVKTVEGGFITIHNKGGVRVNSSKVTKTDIIASNGVIHVIDTVLIPN